MVEMDAVPVLTACSVEKTDPGLSAFDFKITAVWVGKVVGVPIVQPVVTYVDGEALPPTYFTTEGQAGFDQMLTRFAAAGYEPPA